MLKKTQEIHRERLERLRDESNRDNDEIAYELKNIHFELYRFGDESSGLPRPTYLVLLLHMAQEDIKNTISNLEMLVEELEDIENELNKDEINNAK